MNFTFFQRDRYRPPAMDTLAMQWASKAFSLVECSWRNCDSVV